MILVYELLVVFNDREEILACISISERAERQSRSADRRTWNVYVSGGGGGGGVSSTKYCLRISLYLSPSLPISRATLECSDLTTASPWSCLNRYRSSLQWTQEGGEKMV